MWCDWLVYEPKYGFSIRIAFAIFHWILPKNEVKKTNKTSLTQIKVKTKTMLLFSEWMV